MDNHLRPYTGKKVVRRGWRMQDKRVRPGATDYYVHDEDGRPVLRMDAPAHDSLTQWLPGIAQLLRTPLGKEERILVAFDRAGAHPEHMATLPNQGFEFLTYERRPFRKLGPSAFPQEVTFGKKTIAFLDSRTNLAEGRGRVRRIAMRMSDGRQVNLLAVSALPAERLIEVMRGRWSQENGFKHGVERWGINQLDGRKTKPYAPETIIPNPARRRLDRALRLACFLEGQARRELARLPKADDRRERWKREIDDALEQQDELLALRPSVPKRAPLSETELAGKLVRHTSEYKTTIETVRIACANAESELAGELARHLPRPAEAKKALANLFRAPGHIHATQRHITVTLLPAGTRNEQQAFQRLFAHVNRWKLTPPGHASQRALRFRAQLS